MKTLPLFMLVLAGIPSLVTQPAAAQGPPVHMAPSLSAGDMAKIRKEVEPMLMAFLAAAERLDAAGTMGFCLDSPDFRFLLPDGRAMGYAESKKAMGEVFSAFAAQKIPTRQLDTYVLGPDLALCAWGGGDDLIQKDGTVLRSDPFAGTYLFKKVSGVWKIIYCHESGNPFAPVKAAEPSLKK